jgi:DNA polymerase I
VITRGEGTISNRAEPLEYAKDYDPEYYISNQIMPAAMRILNAIGLSDSEIDKSEDNESQKSLNSFMKKSLGRKIKYKWSKKKDEE